MERREGWKGGGRDAGRKREGSGRGRTGKGRGERGRKGGGEDPPDLFPRKNFLATPRLPSSRRAYRFVFYRPTVLTRSRL